jgi:hypothetical protein
MKLQIKGLCKGRFRIEYLQALHYETGMQFARSAWTLFQAFPMACRDMPECSAWLGNKCRLRILLLPLLWLLGLLVCTSTLASSVPAAKPETPDGTFLNPVGDPPIHLRDPNMLVQAKKYYLFGASFLGDGIQCYESPDLRHWSLDGWAVRKTGMRVALGEFRAPQVFLHQGMFCLVYSARMHGGIQLGLAASTKPQGPYHDIHAPWLGLSGVCSAGRVFVNDNGKAYLVYSERKLRNGYNQSVIYGVAISSDLSKTQGQPIKLLEPTQRWELVHRDVTQINDSPCLFKMASKYYLTYSANDPMTPDFGIGYAVADKPLAGWTKGLENPLISTRADIGVVGPGNPSVFRSVDRTDWFMVYDTFADPANPSSDRVVNIDRLVLENRKLAVVGPTRSPQPLPSRVK